MPSLSLVTLKLISDPGLHAGQFHVCQQLGLVDTLDLLDAFQFDDQFVFHQKYQADIRSRADTESLSNSILRALRVLRGNPFRSHILPRRNYTIQPI